jgi:hypothetical protein
MTPSPDAGSEADLLAAIQLALSTGNVRLWRFNAGMSWQGTELWRKDGRLLLGNPRVVRLGARGMSDLIGLKCITVTPAMIGRRLAVFVGIETKSARGRVTPEQADFLAMLAELGALEGIARSVDDARAILRAGDEPDAE